MIYTLYELQRAALAPLAFAAETAHLFSSSLLLPLGEEGLGRTVNATCELLARATRRHRKADFDISEIQVDGRAVPIDASVAQDFPFCTLRRFARADRQDTSRLLVVAPLSGHFAALLNDAVATLAETHEVYIADWKDARDVPREQGAFALDDYIDYLLHIFRRLGPGLDVVAFSQSTVPTLAAAALLAETGDDAEPRSLVLVAGPLDARIHPTPTQQLATKQPLGWYEKSMISPVPFGYPGAGRPVLPGFLQLAGYISHNLDRHMGAHWDFLGRLLQGDEIGAETHRRFYDRFFSVLDLPAEFFLDTLGKVFQQHALARGCLTWRGQTVDPRAISHPALLTIEGGRDDVSAPGQTAVAHRLCPHIPVERRAHHVEPEAGHLSLFYGHHWRGLIAPRINRFLRRA